MSVERLERSTNGLKGRYRKSASPNQCPAINSLVHWTNVKASTLDEVSKVLSTLLRPVDSVTNKSLLQKAQINQPEWADRQYFDRK